MMPYPQIVLMRKSSLTKEKSDDDDEHEHEFILTPEF